MKIRTTKPSNNPYYNTKADGGYNGCIRGTPTDSTATVLSNCIGYANGRFAEIQGLDKIQYQFTSDAENVIEHAKAYGLKVVKYPVEGGMMVFGKGSIYSAKDGQGHVFIVERINHDGSIFTSESECHGDAFYNKTRTNKNGRWGMSEGYYFRGCVVNPGVSRDGKEKPRYKMLKDMPLRKYSYSASKQLGTVGKGEVHTVHKIKEKKDSTWIRIKDGGKWGWVCVKYKDTIYCRPKD